MQPVEPDVVSITTSVRGQLDLEPNEVPPGAVWPGGWVTRRVQASGEVVLKPPPA